jgi:hypothetical protein
VVRRDLSMAIDASDTPLQIRRKMPPQTDVEIAAKFGDVCKIRICGPF